MIEDLKALTNDQIWDLLKEKEKQAEMVRDEFHRRLTVKQKSVEERLAKGDKFTLSELEFAKENRCPCGLLLAYPKGTGPHGYWDCSGILLDIVPHIGQPGAVEHTGKLPFAFYKVK